MSVAGIVGVDARGDALPSSSRADFVPRPREIVLVADGHPVRFVETIRRILDAGAIPFLLPPQTPADRIERLVAHVGAAHVVIGSASGECTVRSTAGRSFPFDAPSFLAATSGTTGASPSIYVFSLERARANAAAHLESIGIRERSAHRLLFPLPLAHSFGFVCGVLAAESIGATLIATTEHPLPTVLLEIARSTRATCLHTTPTAIRTFARAKNARFTSELEVIGMGSAPATGRDAHVLARIAGTARRYATYGLTEAGPRVATLALDDSFVDFPEDRLLPLGELLQGISARIAESDASGEGELRIRTPFLATHRFRDGVYESLDSEAEFATADRATMRDGRIVLLGRADGVVVRGGSNVHPATIEPLFERVPGVRGACVVRRASATYGEVPVLVVEADASETIRAAIEDVSATELMPIERPVDVVFVHALPRTELGKIRRGLVEAEHGGPRG